MLKYKLNNETYVHINTNNANYDVTFELQITSV